MSLALDIFTVFAVAAGGFFFLAGTVGLLRFRAWGIAMAAVILVFNLLGDTWNATAGGDPRGYIGIPVAVALLVYLARQGAKLAASRNPQEDR